jgi:hypothetical protein
VQTQKGHFLRVPCPLATGVWTEAEIVAHDLTMDSVNDRHRHETVYFGTVSPLFEREM